LSQRDKHHLQKTELRPSPTDPQESLLHFSGKKPLSRRLLDTLLLPRHGNPQVNLVQ